MRVAKKRHLKIALINPIRLTSNQCPTRIAIEDSDHNWHVWASNRSDEVEAKHR